MAKPWEKYGGGQKVAPWQKYQDARQTPAQAGMMAVSAGKTDKELTGGELAADAVKSGGIGLVKGGIGMAGTIGDAQDVAGNLSAWIAEKLGASPETASTVKDYASRYSVPVPGAIGVKVPSSSDLQAGIEKHTGKFYEPKSTLGKFSQSVGEFIPGSALGPGGAVRKTAMAVVPAVASEAAGQATEGTAAEPYARIVSALAGGVAAGGRPSSAYKDMRKAAPSHGEVKGIKNSLYGALDNAGVKYDAIGFEQAADDVTAAVKPFRPKKAPLANDTADYVNEFRGQSPSFSDFDGMVQDAKSVLRDRAASDTDKKAAGRILDQLTNFEKNGALSTNGTLPADQVHEVAGHAREMARRDILAKRIKEMSRKSEGYVSGDESGMRNQFGSFVRNEGKTLTPTELSAFKKVVRREGLLNLLTTEGSRFKQAVGPVSGAGLGFMLGGGPIGAVVGGAASYAGHLGARKIMEAVTRKQVQDALKTVLAGRPAQAQAASAAQKIRNDAIVRALLAAQGGRVSAQGRPAPLPVYQ